MVRVAGGVTDATSAEKLTQGTFSLVMLSVAFVLFLISFVSVPLFSNKRQELPPTTSAEAFVAEGGVNIFITLDRQFVVNGSWMPEELFDKGVSALLAERPGRAVSIAADRGLPYATVRGMAARLSRLGVTRLFLVTEDNKMKLFQAAWSSESHV